jgi:hypothetical protein
MKSTIPTVGSETGTGKFNEVKKTGYLNIFIIAAIFSGLIILFPSGV